LRVTRIVLPSDVLFAVLTSALPPLALPERVTSNSVAVRPAAIAIATSSEARNFPTRSISSSFWLLSERSTESVAAKIACATSA